MCHIYRELDEKGTLAMWQLKLPLCFSTQIHIYE